MHMWIGVASSGATGRCIGFANASVGAGELAILKPCDDESPDTHMEMVPVDPAASLRNIILNGAE